MIIDRNLPRYFNKEKEIEYKFKVFTQKEAQKHLNFIKNQVKKTDFNEIEIVINMKVPWFQYFLFPFFAQNYYFVQ